MGIGDPLKPGGAHRHPGAVTAEEALQRHLEFIAEYRARPDVIEREAMMATSLERKKQNRLRERGKAEVYGPPNPYKPHRK